MNKVQELNSVTAAMQDLQARAASLKSELGPLLELFEKVSLEAEEKNISPRELALLLAPDLAPQKVEGKVKTTRKLRDVKKYTNPNTGEVIETKGGNHKVLKEWKAKWGSDVVEGWVEIQSA